MALQLDKKVTIGTLINFAAMVILIISGFVYFQSDLENVKEEQEIQKKFRNEVRKEYINREQLEYMVIRRLDRMEENINIKLEKIEEAVGAK